jgi:polar amino acid transport system substrate-binding protein
MVVANAVSDTTEKLLVLTEESEAHSINANHEISGWEIPPVRAVIERAGFQANFEIQSWKGALASVNRIPTALIYPLARTPDREAQYQWIGRLGMREYNFYKLHDAKLPRLGKLDDFKPYRIAVIRDDVRDNYLVEHGFVKGSTTGLREVSDSSEALQLLGRHEVDFVIFSAAGLNQYCTMPGQKCDSLDLAMPLGLRVDLYIAAGPKAPASEVARLRSAYDAMLKDGSLRKLTDAVTGPATKTTP